MDFNKKAPVLITCGRGLVPFLKAEVEAAGFSVDSEHDTGLTLTGTLTDTMRLNLKLRTAFNVLYQLDHFDCTDTEHLYRLIGRFPWENVVPPDGYLSVVSQASTQAIDNTMFLNQKVKDAIVDRLRKVNGKRPDAGPDRDRTVINVYWNRDKVWVYANTSGEKLSDRSYRKLPYKAPLQESLAAAILLAAGYSGEQPLVNPMCGSGTLAIEAALIATGRAPGLLRSNFGIKHLVGFDSDMWDELRKQIRKEGGKDLKFPIIATDIDKQAIAAARKNAQTAGVDQLIEFSVCDFADTPLPSNPGLIVMNPEYGMRLGEIRELEGTYKRIGDFFKQKAAGWRGCLFTGNLELAKRIGLRTSRRIPMFNADIECRLLCYEMYEGTRKTKNPS
ncbi:MAG: class I SAM-dependent RNA methyltransferase [Clostridiales bacterium]|nr:class I SAM-dependent RNA methyltransferase [Clostridiales bacterium]